VIVFFLMTLAHASFAQDSTAFAQDSTAFAQVSTAPVQNQTETNGTVPPATPERLFAGGFECKETGYHDGAIPDDERIDTPNRIPNGWDLTFNGAMPIVDSARIHFTNPHSCDGSAHVERIEGEDSVLVQARDLEWSAEPGKPFDASLYQQVTVFSGTTYSLSGWMLTLCGGSNTNPRNDCPDGYYMAKMIGIDPTGGVDPNAASVQWIENRRNFVQPDGVTRIGWQNLRFGVTAQAPTITVFARINSPFRWHGNHGFIDALSLVQAPSATLTATLSDDVSIELAWSGNLGPDIPLIAGSTHRLLFDVQYWHEANQRWRDVVSDTDAGGTTFTVACPGSTYRFRVQPRAEQPDGSNGVSPNQRYPGVWSEPLDFFAPLPPTTPTAPLPASEQLFLPLIGNQRSC
jgi:hypothetical protein